MKNLIGIIGILLIIFGIVVFGYRGYEYSTPEKVAQIGDLQITAEQHKVVYFPPALGGISIVAGIALVVISRIKPK